MGSVYIELMRSLKKAVDPNFILSPNRYIFWTLGYKTVIWF
jgi:FAD/FMN-containing dehydrogenase